jgi:cytochrome c oxidase subunit 1
MHYWFPKMFGKMYDTGWANTGLVLFFIGFITLYGPMFYLGVKGMPRRYYDYDPVFHGGNIISSMGSWIMIAGLIIVIVNLFRSARRGTKAVSDPWGGKTLEWTIDSPPTVENFDEIPNMENKGPYDYK